MSDPKNSEYAGYEDNIAHGVLRCILKVDWIRRNFPEFR